MHDCYILKNGTVITMDDHIILRNTDLFIAQGKILKIGHDLSIGDIPEIDVSGKYLMPGLIDSHIHMDSSEITEMLLACGITTARNMWGIPLTQKWIEEIRAGKRFGSSVITTGPLTDGKKYWPESDVVTTPEEGRQAVISTINGGYDYFKAYPWIRRDVFFAIMETANQLGIKVMGHGNVNVTTRELIDSGYYSLEHVNNLPENDEEVLMIAESPMWFCPTVMVVEAIYRNVTQKLPLTITNHYDQMHLFWHEDWERITKWRSDMHRYDENDYEGQMGRAKLFIDHSDNVLVGTDTPNPGVVAGFSMYEEMQHFQDDFCMDTYRILRAATVNPARSMGLQKKGKLKEGMDADILILNKDPLVSLPVYDTIDCVIREGLCYDRSYRDARLDQVKTYSVDELQPWCT